MILADTSAWVEFDRATGSPVDWRITELIGGGGPLAVTEPVVMEVLAGARDERQEVYLRRLLGRCTLLRFDPAADFDAAAKTYRLCRRAGVRPGGIVDCLIASVARRHGAALLTADRGLVRVARVAGVELDTAT